MSRICLCCLVDSLPLAACIFRMCNGIRYAFPQFQAQSGHCLFEEVSQNSKISIIAHFSNQILRLLTEAVDLLGSLKVLQQHVPVWVTFELAQFIVELFLFDFSTCSTAECGMPRIRKSTQWSLPQVALC